MVSEKCKQTCFQMNSVRPYVHPLSRRMRCKPTSIMRSKAMSVMAMATTEGKLVSVFTDLQTPVGSRTARSYG